MKPGTSIKTITGKGVFRLVLLLGLACLLVWGYQRTSIPVARVSMSSSLRMLGDLNDDRRWTPVDCDDSSTILAEPYSASREQLARLDLNGNDEVDPDDQLWLSALCKLGDPYAVLDRFSATGRFFARPRELFRYVPRDAYIRRPPVVVQHAAFADSPLSFLKEFRRRASDDSDYAARLKVEIYDEALRFSIAYAGRRDEFNQAESEYAQRQIAQARRLRQDGQLFELLYHLIMLTELAETTTLGDVPSTAQQIRLVGEDLGTLLVSDQYARFAGAEIGKEAVLQAIETIVKQRTGIKLVLADLGPPRDLTDVRNYVDRAKWQQYKAQATEQRLRDLVRYAQNDRRYLRAVARTAPRHADAQLRNHNIAMMLLFREALRICNNDKLSAVGLIDEAVRIPFQWIKSLPRDWLPTSVALDHFLLPGNMEDGSDKSRHWNVFGGIALYRSPEESLRLAFAREMQDARDGDFSPEAMTEFVRDMIANCNGIFHVVIMQPGRHKRQ